MLDPTEVSDFSLTGPRLCTSREIRSYQVTCDYSTSPCLAMNNMPVIIIMSALNTETLKVLVTYHGKTSVEREANA